MTETNNDDEQEEGVDPTEGSPEGLWGADVAAAVAVEENEDEDNGTEVAAEVSYEEEELEEIEEAPEEVTEED